jgi:hypothetical protein
MLTYHSVTKDNTAEEKTTSYFKTLTLLHYRKGFYFVGEQFESRSTVQSDQDLNCSLLDS